MKAGDIQYERVIKIQVDLKSMVHPVKQRVGNWQETPIAFSGPCTQFNNTAGVSIDTMGAEGTPAVTLSYDNP